MLREELGNTVRRARLWNTVLREGMVEHFAEREIGGTLIGERDWGKNVLREKLDDHCAERKIGGKM